MIKLTSGRGFGEDNKQRKRKGRARNLSRASAKDESFIAVVVTEHESLEKRKPNKKAIPACLDCGSIMRDRRKFIGAWAPFCFDCWRTRGKPSLKEARAIAKALEEEKKTTAELEHKRKLAAGEIPW